MHRANLLATKQRKSRRGTYCVDQPLDQHLCGDIRDEQDSLLVALDSSVDDMINDAIIPEPHLEPDCVPGGVIYALIIFSCQFCSPFNLFLIYFIEITNLTSHDPEDMDFTDVFESPAATDDYDILNEAACDEEATSDDLNWTKDGTEETKAGPKQDTDGKNQLVEEVKGSSDEAINNLKPKDSDCVSRRKSSRRNTKALESRLEEDMYKVNVEQNSTSGSKPKTKRSEASVNPASNSRKSQTVEGISEEVGKDVEFSSSGHDIIPARFNDEKKSYKKLSMSTNKKDKGEKTSSKIKIDYRNKTSNKDRKISKTSRKLVPQDFGFDITDDNMESKIQTLDKGVFENKILDEELFVKPVIPVPKAMKKSRKMSATEKLSDNAEDSSSGPSDNEFVNNVHQPNNFNTWMAKPGKMIFTVGRKNVNHAQMCKTKEVHSRAKSKSTLPKPVRSRSRSSRTSATAKVKECENRWVNKVPRSSLVLPPSFPHSFYYIFRDIFSYPAKCSKSPPRSAFDISLSDSINTMKPTLGQYRERTLLKEALVIIVDLFIV